MIFLTLLLTTCGGDGDLGPTGSEFNKEPGRSPEGGNVFSLAIDLVNTTTLYAGTVGGGVFKSDNGGANWTVISTGLTYTDIIALAIAPVTTSTIYAGMWGGRVFSIYVPNRNHVLIEAYAAWADSSRETPKNKLTTVAEPINVAYGNMFISQQDIFIPGNGIPLDLTRTYNSRHS